MKRIWTIVLTMALAGCGTTIRTGEVGVKYAALKKPALQQELKPEGFYFRWPWNGYVVFPVTWQSRTEPVEVLTADALHVATRVTVTFRPDRARLHELATQIGRRYYDDVIRPPFVALARTEFGRHLHADLARNAPVVEQKIADALREAIGGRPLQVDRVSIDHVAYDPTVTKAISAKLAMQELLAQKKFEVEVADRDADILRTQAKAQADALGLRAEGEAKAIVIKGQAQARAQTDIAKTLSTEYLQYKAFDNAATRYYFVPINKNGLPIIIGGEAAPARIPPG